MKLGKPKRYTLFRNDNISSTPPPTTKKGSSNPVIISMANSNSHNHHLVTSMSSWLLVPKGKNFRQILGTVLCVILVYHVTLLAIPTTNSIPSSSSNGALFGDNKNPLINSMPVAVALTACESCEDNELLEASSNNQISQPQNDVVQKSALVGTSAKAGSQGVEQPNRHHAPQGAIQFRRSSGDDARSGSGNPNPESNFASPQPAETSGSNYNYYYTDEIGSGAVNGKVAPDSSDNSSSGGDNDKSNNDNRAEAMKPNGGNANMDDNAKPQTHRKTISNVKKNANKHERANNKKLLNIQYQKRRKLLDSVFLSIKSTKRFHETRLGPVINTWFNLAKDQTWIFTDDDDPDLNQKTNGHVVNTHCPSTHYRQALCCKMSAEFDTFMKSQKSWFCHFDDDNYVNVPALLDLLSKYDHKEDWYLGKPSLKVPIKIPHPDNKSEEISFWFATGGAGFCLSRAMAKRMSPVASGGKFTKLCDTIQLPDDVTMGYIAGHLLGRNLTVIPQFHSHYETMRFLDMKNPYPEITFSYVRYMDNSLNTLEIDGFSEGEDPTRFLSLHCILFPNFSFCPKNRR